MKKVQIPTCMNPFSVDVNGKKYVYPAGTEQEVPDEVALVIESHYKHHNAQPETPKPPFGGGWNDLKDRPFGEMPTGGDTLYWDGNTEGLTEVLCEFAPDEFKFYKVSDAVFTDEEIGTMSATFFDGHYAQHDAPFFEQSDFSKDSVSSDAFPFVVFIRKAGAIAFDTMGGQVFPAVGVYFFKPAEGAFTSSLTVPNYAGFPSTKRIDEKYMPLLTSPSGKKFKLSVSDNGTITATEV